MRMIGLCLLYMYQGESPDGDSMPQPSATLEVKRKRKNKTVAKVNEGKTNEATVTDASPKTQNATETLLSHSNNFGKVIAIYCCVHGNIVNSVFVI